MLDWLMCIGGIIALFVGGDFLVRGASRLAFLLGMTQLMIGLTVVSFGTSAPELAVCVDAVLSSKSEIAVGNIVGSNICNVLLVLGSTALIVPLAVQHQLVRIDVPIMIGASFLFLFLSLDNSLSRMDGAVLAVLMTSYIGLLVFLARRNKRNQKVNAENEKRRKSLRKSLKFWLRSAGSVLLGLVLLAAGGNWLVSGAAGIASSLGMSQLVIGLTIVAIGSSCPELVTAIVAALQGERDIAVGNVVGSNIANLLFIGGISGLVAPDGIQVPADALNIDMPVMIAAAVACLPIFICGYRINRWEGGLFLFYFFAYMTYLLLENTKHQALPTYSFVMWFFVVPLTGITLVVVMFRTYKENRMKQS